MILEVLLWSDRRIQARKPKSSMLIFGYGSLMNPDSLAKTSTDARIIGRATLRGHQRKANAMNEAFPEVAMNVVPNEAFSVTGALIQFPENDLPALQKRETGYEMVDITNQLEDEFDESVYTFIAPDSKKYEGKQIRQEYLEVCLGGVPAEEREQWLLETVVECGISGESKDREFRHA